MSGQRQFVVPEYSHRGMNLLSELQYHASIRSNNKGKFDDSRSRVIVGQLATNTR
jgi:hypothetical protein